MFAKRSALTVILAIVSLFASVTVYASGLPTTSSRESFAPHPAADRVNRLVITILNSVRDFPGPYVGSRVYLSPDDKSYKTLALSKIAGLYDLGRSSVLPPYGTSSRQYTGKLDFQSPDGTSEVSFTARPGGDTIILVATAADANGSNPRSIGTLTGAVFVVPPAWSPDNKQILLTELVADQKISGVQSKYHILNLDGSQPQEIVPDKPVSFGPFVEDSAAFYFSAFLPFISRQLAFWTPDGKRIIAYGNLNTPTSLLLFPLVIMDADGKNVSYFLKDHSQGVDNASWSPDGKHLLFEYGDLAVAHIIATSNPDGSAFQPLYTDISISVTNSPLWLALPAWSPDGSQIAFITSGENHKPAVWLMNADGTNARAFFSLNALGILIGEKSAVIDLSWEAVDDAFLASLPTPTPLLTATPTPTPSPTPTSTPLPTNAATPAKIDPSLSLTRRKP